MKTKFNKTLLASFLCVAAGFSNLSHSQQSIDSSSKNYQPIMKQIAKSMWEAPELGFLEHDSSALMQAALAERGFTIKTGVAGMPTAFVAEYGDTGPVIGLLAEMDALPGMGVKNTPDKQPIATNGHVHAGHACGHNLFAGGVIGSALALADYLDKHPQQGKIKVFGTPAEEGGSGKVYMVREGLFNDVDVALHWHPSDRTTAAPYTSLANKSGKFRFYGVAAHAAAAPDRGRSALDAVEAMNMMVNLMREHVPDGTRIHYVITHGGTAPNIVPEFAEVYYYVRSVEPATVLSLWDRLNNAAEGAALGTQTRVEVEVTGGVWSVLPNVALSKIADQAIVAAQPITLSKDEQAFASNISETLNHSFNMQEHSSSLPFSEKIAVWSASTDVGDVSWQVPTVGISSATWVKGTPPHTWQASAMSGTDIGYKGMYLASEVLTKTAIDLFAHPDNIEAAKKEYLERKDALKYKSMIGDRAPALEYRKK